MAHHEGKGHHHLYPAGEEGFSPGTLTQLKQGRHVSTHSIDHLCSLLGCGVPDVMEYIAEAPAGKAPDENP